MKYLYFLLMLLLVSYSNSYSQTLDELFNGFHDYFLPSDYKKALAVTEQSLKKAEKDFGTNSIEYAKALRNIARAYEMNADSKNAEQTFLRSLDIFKDKKGESSTYYSYVALDLAILYSHDDKFRKAEPLFLRLCDLNKNSASGNDSLYLSILERTAYFYFDYYVYDKCEKVYKEIYDILRKKGWENCGGYTLVMSNFAIMYEEQQKYKEAIPILEDVITVIEATKGRGHQDCINTLIELIDMMIKVEMYDSVEPLISKAIKINIEGLSDFFVYSTEEDKTSTLESLYGFSDIYYTIGLRQKDRNKELLKDVLNFRLATKGLTLSSTKGVRNKLSKYGNENFILHLDDLLKIKSDIALCNTLPLEEQKRKGLNLKSLKRAADSVEYILNSGMSDILMEEAKKYDVKFDDIKSTLKQDEAAIDYINFVQSEKDKSDSIYCAFIILPDSEYPEFIKLCTYSELNNLILEKDEYYKSPEILNKLYKLIFLPVERLIGSKKKIYVSPDGMLNKVSFAALQSDDKEYLIDKYNVENLLNINEIVIYKNTPDDSQIKDASIFGGINYTLDSAEFINASKNSRRDLSSEFENIDLSDYLSGSFVRGKGIPYLKGTLEETESINKILTDGGIQTSFYSGNNGTEEAFKNLTGKNSPSLIHISTHGYYFPEPEQTFKEDTNVRQSSTARGNYKINSNPLVRSGLIFAGADFIWNKGKRFQGTEDGILTALEVTCMDLENTKLVVLSACETGLGDIKNGEGVFGLNRAFKIAGAKNLIISLWQVPDKETSELMNNFYKNWITGKMSIEEAFHKAQKDLKQKYNEPFYWSAFILI